MLPTVRGGFWQELCLMTGPGQGWTGQPVFGYRWEGGLCQVHGAKRRGPGQGKWAQAGWQFWAEDPGMALPEPAEAASWLGRGGERPLQLVAHGTRPASPSRKLEQRSDRQGQRGLGRQKGGGHRDGGR